MQRVPYTFDNIPRQIKQTEMMEPAKTNVIMLDTTTLLSLLIITVFIVQVFSLTIHTNNAQTLIGRRSYKRSVSTLVDAKVFRRQKRTWRGEYTWRNKFRKRNSFAFGKNNHYSPYEESAHSYTRYITPD